MYLIRTDFPGAADWPLPPGLEGIPMQTHAWTLARAGLVADSALHLMAVRNRQGIQALAPLVRVGGCWREPPAMFEPSDFIWRTPEGLQTLADALATDGLPLHLERLPADSPTLQALRRAYRRRGLVLVRPAMPTPVIELEGRDDDFERWGNAGRRSDFRRAERRAAGYGTVSYEILAPAPASDLGRLIDDVMAVETRSWKYRAGTALTADRAQGAFFVRFMQAAKHEGSLRVAFLRIDGLPVAMQIASEWKERFWLFKMSYDADFAPCSPGQLLLRHTLRHAAAAGLRSYEFMGIMDDRTRQWTHQTRRYVQVRAIPYSTAALAALARQGARGAFQRLRRVAGRRG